MPKGEHSADLVSPTPERMQRAAELLDQAIPGEGERMRLGIELVEQQVVCRNGKIVVEAQTDDEGVAIRAYRSIDILAAMERRGAITEEMRQAGEEFQEQFRRAYTGDLRASDPSRPLVSGTKIAIPIEGNHGAFESVYKTIQALGGIGSPGASCVWNVLGWGQSLTEWATEQGWRGKRVHVSAAPMVLITALGVLAGPPKSS